MEVKVMNDPFSINAMPWFIKIFAVVIGVLFALILSGDIDSNGNFKVTPSLLIRGSFGVTLSLFGGQAFIEYQGLLNKSVMYHGFIMIMFAVFGLLVISILYQAVAMWKGKTLAEIISEVKAAFAAVFGGKP